MSEWIEWSKLALQAVTCLVAGFGLFFATRQLRLLRTTYFHVIGGRGTVRDQRIAALSDRARLRN